jgi:hypothetical protein
MLPTEIKNVIAVFVEAIKLAGGTPMGNPESGYFHPEEPLKPEHMVFGDDTMAVFWHGGFPLDFYSAKGRSKPCLGCCGGDFAKMRELLGVVFDFSILFPERQGSPSVPMEAFKYRTPSMTPDQAGKIMSDYLHHGEPE